MKRKSILRVALSVCLLIEFPSQPPSRRANDDLWVTAYYAGWMQGWYNNGVLPAEEIDYSAVTHIIHFGLWPNADGSSDSLANSIREMNSSALITSAHAAGKKVLISVGGWGSAEGFRGATGLLNRGKFIENLVSFMERRGYDGIDIDWESLEPSDGVQYVLFVRELRERLDTLAPRPLLTAAATWEPALFAVLADEFDQINIMTYDLSGAWPGWVSWHNSPIFDGGFLFPSTGQPPPSANGLVDLFLAAGVPPTKVGVGIDFYGYIWSGGGGTTTGGVTEPRQSWRTPPSVRSNVPYHRIVEDFYHPLALRWDASASASYLSIEEEDSANDKFISFDDEITCLKKVEYVRSRKLGGVMIWELGGGYLPSGYAARDRLLQAVKSAVWGVTAVLPPLETRPKDFRLYQNYPNPFNGETKIAFDLPRSGTVSVDVYDLVGERVATVSSGFFPAGHHAVQWSTGLASGVYFYRLVVDGAAVRLSKMILAR